MLRASRLSGCDRLNTFRGRIFDRMNPFRFFKDRLGAKESFLRNFVMTVSGTVIARALTLMALPLLTRHYDPAQIGLWQLFVYLGLILDTLATGRYTIAIPLHRSDRQASTVFWLCLTWAMVFCLLVLAFNCIVPNAAVALIGDPLIADWLWAIPLLILGLSIEQTAGYWLTRKRRFNILAQAKIWKALGTVGIPLSLILLDITSPHALITGTILGQSLTASILLTAALRDPDLTRWWNISFQQLKLTAYRYRNYPLFMAPYAFLSQGGQRTLFFLLAAYSSRHFVGLFALAMQVTYIPVTFLTNSLNQVLYPRIVARVREGTLELFVVRLLAAIGMTAAPWFVIVAFFSNTIVATALGAKWLEAGPYMAAATLPAFMLLQTTWLTRIYDVHHKQRLALALQVGYDTVAILTFWSLLQAGVAPITAVATHCCLNAAYNLIWLIVTFRVAQFDVRRLIPIYSAMGLSMLIGFGTCQLAATSLTGLWQPTAAAAAILTCQLSAFWFWRKGKLDVQFIRSLETVLGKANAPALGPAERSAARPRT